MPLLALTPVLRDFSFAEVSGNVERFEAGTRWPLLAEWGSCRVFVFGDDAATFEFVEHPEGPDDNEVGGSAVANSDVLD